MGRMSGNVTSHAETSPHDILINCHAVKYFFGETGKLHMIPSRTG